MSKKWSQPEIDMLLELYDDYTYKQIATKLNRKFGTNHTQNATKKAYARFKYPILTLKDRKDAPKILLYDLETSPIEAYVWSLWDQNVGLNQVLKESSVLSYAAKWYGSDDIMYEDVRNQKDLRDDRKILKNLHKLIDECDILVGHNSNSFDIKVMNGRFINHKMKPPSSYKKMDTLKMVKKHFKFMSNKLEHLTNSLCETNKKSLHGKFSGFTLWSECLKGNVEAFKEMEDYNMKDVTSLEELFTLLLPWESSTLFDVYNNSNTPKCTCGSSDFKKSGFYYTNASKFQKYKCKKCGAESRDNINLLNKKTRKGTTR